MKLIELFFQCVLSLLLSYAAFVSVYLSFLKNQYFDFLTFIFVCSLILLTIFSFYRIYQLIKKNLSEKPLSQGVIQNPIFSIKQFSKNKGLLIVFVICLVSLFAGFFNVWAQYSRGMFMDELGQFLNSSSTSDIIKASYKQQQPPLDYYFSAFVNELWKQQSKVSLRFHAMLFYLILSFILPLGIYRFSSSIWLTSIGTLLFLINHLVRLHSVYARPLSLALLTGFLFLFFYMSYCNNNRSKKQMLFFPILASQYLFVMSVGLQPVVFIISLFFSSSYLLFKNKKTLFKNLLLSHFITALFVSPFYIKMYFYGKAAYKFKTISQETIIDYFYNYNIFDLFKRYFFPFYEQLTPLILPLVISFGVVVFIKKKISELTVMTGSALIIFPLLYDFIFHVFIKWPHFNDWYFIVLSLLLILFTVLALQEIYHYLKTIKWRFLWTVPMTTLFLYFMSSQILAIKNDTQFRHPYSDNSMKKVYDYLKEAGNSNDVAVDFSLKTISSFKERDTYFHKNLFYKPEAHPKIIQVKYIKNPSLKSRYYIEFNIYYIDWTKFSKKGKQKIFLIVKLFIPSDETYNILSDVLKSQRFGRYIVFELSLTETDKEQEYIKFLSFIIKKTPKKQKPTLYETLLYYACKNKNKKEFNQLLREYRGLESALDIMNPYFHFPNSVELGRRIKYFEKRNCDNEN